MLVFKPSAPGLRSATVTIPNNDPDENPYVFAIQGTGIAPEMDLQGNGVSIADGDDTPATSDDTDFGEVEVAAGAVEHTFTIENTGNAELNLTGGSPLVVVTGDGFSLVTDAATPVAADGGTATFTIRFEPAAAGVVTGAVSIANNDADENPYDFVIQGSGVVPVTSDWTNVSPGTAPAPRYWHARRISATEKYSCSAARLAGTPALTIPGCTTSIPTPGRINNHPILLTPGCVWPCPISAMAKY